jgi:pimeloyl-ACP methyl ester carboxylesterase
MSEHIQRVAANAPRDELQTISLRVHDGCGASLIYLPGVHGDWTLVGGFRRALGTRVRFVELMYPRIVTWSLRDYACRVEAALAEAGVWHGWLLGESFGSQVVWAMLKQGTFTVDGVILAGGFARHPVPWMATAATFLLRKPTLKVLRAFLFAYVQVARYRFRRSPETMAGIREFVDRRTEQDCKAVHHRLQLVAQNDPREIAKHPGVRVYALTGFFDPIVPWYGALRWFRRECAMFCGYRMIWAADHNVLGSAPEAAAAQVLEWISG